MHKNLYTGFYLTGSKGNNAFSYEERRLKNVEPKLYVASVKEGDVHDLETGDEIVFEDFDDAVLKSCTGLKYFIKTEFCGVPVVIFDNHNHAFYFWTEALRDGLFVKGATLIHVDQHKDTRVPEAPYTGKSLADAFLYTNEVLNVGNYIVPAVEADLFGRVLQVNSIGDLRGVCKKLDGMRGEIMLNLDMDFFAPEMGVDFGHARADILHLFARAKFITIATSPFFIDQELALDLLKKLLYNLEL